MKKKKKRRRKKKHLFSQPSNTEAGVGSPKGDRREGVSRSLTLISWKLQLNRFSPSVDDLYCFTREEERLQKAWNE